MNVPKRSSVDDQAALRTGGVSASPTPTFGSEASAIWSSTGEARSSPLLLLQIFVWMIVGLPARLVVGAIGSFGSPASLVGIICFALWAVSAAQPGSLARTVWPVRSAALVLAMPTMVSYGVMHLHSNPADEVNGSDRGLLFLIVWSGVALLAAEGLRGTHEMIRLLRTLTAAVAFASAVAITQTRLGFDLTTRMAQIPGLTVAGDLESVLSRSGFRRPAGTATHPIELGCVLAVLLGFAIVLAVHDHEWSRWRRWTALAVIAVGIPSSISRSGIIGAAIALVFWWAGADRLNRRRTQVALLGFGVLVFVSTPGLLGTLKNWFAGWSTDESISTRTDDYPVVARFIRNSPWIGRGPSTYLPKFRILDNQWLLSMIEVGLLGALGLAAYLLIGGILGNLARSASTDPLVRGIGQAMMGASVVAIVSSASFDSFSFPMFPGIWAAILGMSGLMYGCVRDGVYRSSPATNEPVRSRMVAQRPARRRAGRRAT
ncbi:MAG TPA: O-antigen ligase family protein [Ilumatobacteraceae bacterium]|nr:O-antigen ligase family protein [Ilumatobacteraceae bacterium]